LCIFKPRENNIFIEIKIHHRVSNMFLNSCWCIEFIVMSGFDPKLKMIQVLLKWLEIKEKGKQKGKTLPLLLRPAAT